VNGDHVTDDRPVSSLSVPVAGDQRPTLIESWLPIQELGIEGGRRETNPRPPLNGFHVWWARRPLAACQGAQLAAVLPTFDELADGEFESEREYRQWVLRLTGILGDPVTKAAEIDAANAEGRRLPSNPYGYRPAFNNSPSLHDLARLQRILIERWGRLPVVLDPTAGGGAIPFSSMRYGLPTLANDLNPVAVGILEATLKTASLYGPDFADEVEKWAQVLMARCEERLAPFFQLDDPGEDIIAYLWVNTVACPRTGGPVPLAPNWWLAKGKGGVAVQPVPVRNADGIPSHIEYRVIDNPKSHGFDPGEGTVKGGDAVSLWDEGVVDGDWIKGEAQAGRMWPELYAVAASKPKQTGRGKTRYFRPATRTDLDAVEAAEDELRRLSPRWGAEDVIPGEEIGVSNYDRGHRLYGMTMWRDMFSPRQLLVHGVFIEEWRSLVDEVRATTTDQQRADEIATVLGMVQAKMVNWNSKFASWNVLAQGLRSTFDSHNYSFKWAFGEFESARALLGWGFSSLLGKFREVMRIAQPSSDGLLSSGDDDVVAPGRVELSAGSATSLPHLADGSVECVNIDPPYYDNVQYAELADFFYVWEKRTLGTLYPDRFITELTDKDNEAVTNPARFDFAKGKQRKQLADADYESKMRDIFAEARRVLRDDGVMVVWFTHKKAEAWDTLGAALMDAGFTIETSWPVNTESAVSLHQANVNAAKSTIVLVCRKRLVDDTSKVFFEDIESDMRAAARRGAEDFEPIVGHGGVDLMLSTYGPTLSVLSRRWPVYRSEADASGNLVPIRPEEALDIARAEVAKLRIARLVGHERRFDPTTDFVVLSWSLFADVGFPFDEARKLALGVGADVNGLLDDKVLAKKGSNVSLVDPRDRVQRRLKPEGPFANLYDAVSVMLRLYTTDGAGAVRSWLVEHGYEHSTEFKEVVLALANAVPRVQDHEGQWSVELAEVIDEVATNVPTLGLRLADVERNVAVPVAQQETLAFGLET
jgi:putative DNA methylase